MVSKRAITLVGTLCSLGLASGAGAQSWSDKLNAAGAAATEGVNSSAQQAADTVKAQEEAGAKAVAASKAEDVELELQEAADATTQKAEDSQAGTPPAIAEGGMKSLQDAATTGTMAGTEAAMKGADLGSAAQQGGAAAVNKYMGGGDAGTATSGTVAVPEAPTE